MDSLLQFQAEAMEHIDRVMNEEAKLSQMQAKLSHKVCQSPKGKDKASKYNDENKYAKQNDQYNDENDENKNNWNVGNLTIEERLD